MAINKNLIKQKSVLTLPDNPSENGISANDIKNSYIDPVLELADQVVSTYKTEDELKATFYTETEVDAMVGALDTRLDTAESDIDSLQASIVKKVDYYADNSNTMTDLYNAIGSKPSVVKCGNDTLIITLVTSGTPATQYAYAGLVIANGSNSDSVAKAWARTYFANLNDTIANTINGIKGDNYRIQSKALLTSALNSYYTKTQVDGFIASLTSSINGKVAKQSGNNVLYGNDSNGDVTTYTLGIYGDSPDVYMASEIESRFAKESDMEDVQDLIPSQATSSNKLADKDFVNSSIATHTAYFLGTLNVVSDLGLSYGALTSAIANALDSYEFESKTNNDYCFVENRDANNNELYQRFKYNGTNFLYEYTLNNSSFTSNQWASINSGITSTKVATYDGYASGKLDKVATSTSNDQLYLKASGGTQGMVDLSSSVVNNSVVKRDASGRVKMATPSANEDGVNKQYFDNNQPQISKTLLSDGTYLVEIYTDASQLLGGNF